MDSTLFIIGTALFILLLGVGIFLSLRHSRLLHLKKSLSRKLLLIRLVQQQPSDRPDAFKQDINQFEQLLGIVASLAEHTTFEAAVHHVGEEIHFYVAVQEKQVSFISRQIEGLFKDARIEEIQEYNIFQPNGYSVGFYLKQHEHFAMPLRTYVESESDTFSPIINSFSKLQAIGEGAALQILVRNADKQYKKSINSILSSLKKGGTFSASTSQKLFDLKEARQQLVAQEEKQEEKEKVIDEDTIKQVEKKLSKPLLEVNVRGIVSERSQLQADSLFDTIASSLSHFETPHHNKIDAVKVRNIHKIAYQFTFREFADDQRMILNTEEIASLFHLPTFSTFAPKIKWLKAKDAAPPTDLPNAGTYIGDSAYRNTIQPVYILDEDRRKHIYIVGQTGTGKSALMSNMAIDDIKQGKGVCLIDPHGDLVESVLGCIPQQRQKDVIVFDPGNIKKPIGLNMLEFDQNHPEEKTFIVNEIQSIFNKLFLAETMGPMFEQYMRNALLLLMEDAYSPAGGEPATLVEIPRIFTDDDYRQKKLARITNPVVLDFWQKEAMKVTGEASLSSMAPYITSKFNNFIANDYVRPIIGQTQSSFNFRKIMDEKKILLVSLAKGKIGELNAGLLGMIVVGKLLLAAFSRVDTPQEQRTDFNLYIDEFQNFTTDSIATILSEARKYRLNLTIAHQFIAQLEEKIRNSVFGNVGSMIVFRVGVQDTEFLEKQFAPTFTQSDLTNIDNLNAYVKLLIRGQTSKPFNIKTPSYQNTDAHTAQYVRELSNSTYGTNQKEVEADILRRLRM